MEPTVPQILISVSRWGYDVSETGTPYPTYGIGEADDSGIGGGNVRATLDEMRAWDAAGTAFRDAIWSARDTHRRLVRSRYRWLLLLPGHERRLDRAARKRRRLIREAQTAYQPVFDEIVRREAAAKAERQRQLACAARPIWGWSVVDASTVRVGASTEQGLTAAELAEALSGLYESGARTVVWDQEPRDAVVRASAPPGTPPSDREFRLWWSAVTQNRWKDPARIPAPRPTHRRGGGRHATGHHTDHGGGDVAGSHGTSF